jgi:cytochrome c-type biogenesis protein
MEFTNITIGFAFLAGIASFLSPCVFALVPAYIGYLGGRSVSAGKDNNTLVTFTHGLAFVFGFSLVFIVLGFLAAAIGGVLDLVRYDLQIWLARIGGVIVIIFGLHMIGIFRINFLEYDTRRQAAPDRKLGYLASVGMGVFFAAGWSPCVGPILGAILTLAFSGGSALQGVILLSAYSAGLAIPFLIASIYIGTVTTVIRRYGKVMRYIEIATGLILVVLGVMLLTGQLGQLNSQFASLGSFFDVTDEVKVGTYILIGVVVLMVLGLIPALIARRKGRKFLDWWFFGFGLFPIALPYALLMKPSNIEKEEDQLYPDRDAEEALTNS